MKDLHRSFGQTENYELFFESQLQNQKHIKQKTKTQNTPQNKPSKQKTLRPEQMAQES